MNPSVGEDFNVKDFIKKLEGIFDYMLDKNHPLIKRSYFVDFEKTYKEEIKKKFREIDKIGFYKHKNNLGGIGMLNKLGALKNRLLNDAHREFMINKNIENLKKYLNLANSALGSLSFLPVIGNLFESLKEFKDCAESCLDFPHFDSIL